MKKNVHITINGKVQGIWFRANTKQKAEQLGITGWVKNIPNGSVEAIFEGEENCIKEMIDWCQHGPPQAKVENIEIKEQSITNGFDEFLIKY